MVSSTNSSLSRSETGWYISSLMTTSPGAADVAADAVPGATTAAPDATVASTTPTPSRRRPRTNHSCVIFRSPLVHSAFALARGSTAFPGVPGRRPSR